MSVQFFHFYYWSDIPILFGDTIPGKLLILQQVAWYSKQLNWWCGWVLGRLVAMGDMMSSRSVWVLTQAHGGPPHSAGYMQHTVYTSIMHRFFQIFLFNPLKLCIVLLLNSPPQMWNLQKSACDGVHILSIMALNNTDLWWLTAF